MLKTVKIIKPKNEEEAPGLFAIFGIIYSMIAPAVIKFLKNKENLKAQVIPKPSDIKKAIRISTNEQLMDDFNDANK